MIEFNQVDLMSLYHHVSPRKGSKEGKKIRLRMRRVEEINDLKALGLSTDEIIDIINTI